jgi:predicted membrane GTPase involved in stress response
LRSRIPAGVTSTHSSSRQNSSACSRDSRRGGINRSVSSADNFEKIVPPRRLSLEQSLEFCREDECVEVTPEAVRIRKVELDQTLRARAAARARNS